MPGVFDIEQIRWPTVGRYAVGGALAGGGAASVLALLHLLQQASKEKREAEEGGTSEETITLTLPRRRQKLLESQGEEYKAAEDYSEPVDASPVKMRKKKVQAGGLIPLTKKRQIRHYDGRFGKNADEKRANWQTLLMSALAAGLGGTAGYMLVDKLYNARRMARKRELADQARQEYLDMLMPKKAAAQGRSFSTLDWPPAIAILSLLLGAGGTAYLTKRILDEYAEETRRAGKDQLAPQVKRVVFKTAETAENVEVESEKIAAMIGIYLDICSGKPDILGDERCAAEMDKMGTDAGKVYKSAASKDYASLMATLEANPKFRRLIQRVAAEQHPILRHAKWLLNLPGISGIADRKLYQEVQQQLGPKTAQFRSPGSMLAASIVGSQIAEEAAERGRAKAIAKAKAMEEPEETPQERAQRVLAELTIATEDPAAAEFVARNAPAIKKLLKELALTGRI